jgi:hypothetical protein
LVKRLRLRKGDRRQSERLKLSILNIVTALRILHWISGLGFGICDLEFVILNFEFVIWVLEIWSLGFYSFTE